MKQTRSSQNDVPTNQQNFDNPGILASTKNRVHTIFFNFSTNVELESRLDYGKSPPPPKKKNFFYCYDRRLCLGKMHGSRFNNQ